MSTEPEVKLGAEVRQLAELLDSVQTIVSSFDEKGASGPAFEAACHRWDRWRRTVRQPREKLNPDFTGENAYRYLAPHAMHLDLTATAISVRERDTLTFTYLPEYDGDTTDTVEVPVNYFVDPGGWEKWALTEGGYRTVATLEREEQARRRDRERAAADEEFTRARRLVESRGFAVKPQGSGEIDKEDW